MQRIHLNVGALLVCLVHVFANDATTECVSGTPGVPDTFLLQKGRFTGRLSKDFGSSRAIDNTTENTTELYDIDNVDPGPYGVDMIPYGLLNSMVISNPYKCKFLEDRSSYDQGRICDKDIFQIGLHPRHLTKEGNQSYLHVNLMRLYLPIGSLPCCPTPPYCAAPRCAEMAHSPAASNLKLIEQQAPWECHTYVDGQSDDWCKAQAQSTTAEYEFSFTEGKLELCGNCWCCKRKLPALNLLASSRADKVRTCTKRPAAVNYAYMVHPEIWPAYYGTGGAYELDVQKHWDVLGRLKGFNPEHPPFDLVIDLGANAGHMTEKLVMRRFAKDFLMVEAAPNLRENFDKRLGNPQWRSHFVAESTTPYGASDFKPNFEFKTFAISDKSGGVLDVCNFNWSWGNHPSCTSEVATVDSIIPGKLSYDFAMRFEKAQSAYVKVDVEGMDLMALRGMNELLKAKRGKDYLVNFMMLEFCAPCMEKVRKMNNLASYDLKLLSSTLESLGFEAFMMGPRYLPLTHGSWDDAFVKFSADPENKGCTAKRFPKIKDAWPEWCSETETIWTSDIFAMRASHPQAADIKIALGACEQSVDFNPHDVEYNMVYAD